MEHSTVCVWLMIHLLGAGVSNEWADIIVLILYSFTLTFSQCVNNATAGHFPSKPASWSNFLRKIQVEEDNKTKDCIISMLLMDNMLCFAKPNRGSIQRAHFI